MLIKFTIPLDYHLPIDTTLTYVSHYPDFATFRFRFLDEEIEKTSENYKLPKSISHRTLVMMEYVPGMNVEDWDGQTILRTTIVNSIIFLNNFFDAFRLTSNYEFVRNITISELPKVLEMHIDNDLAIYVTEPLENLIETNIDKRFLSEALTMTTQWRLDHKFEAIHRFRSRARYHFYNEEYFLTITELQTSFEAYIRLCQSLILKARGLSEAEIAKQQQSSFRNAVEHLIAGALGVNLSFDHNSIVSRW